jgi:glycosyltransferase involved in cell wall biosynthesis
MTFSVLTIVTSCIGYGKYLGDWTDSILAQTVRPGRVCIFTHGSQKDYLQAETAMMRLIGAGISCYHTHSPDQVDFGTARNRAVELADTEWVMHLDADDMLFPEAIAELARVAPSADVVQSGYERINCACTKKRRLYEGGDGEAMLAMTALASGNSMFRRSLWEQRPYRTDLLGAWDTALWIGFSRLGARFRPTTMPVFKYRQHNDSIFNRRQTMMGWDRVHTNAMLKALRRNYDGVAIIVPRDLRPSPERQRNWERVRAHYARNHPEWPIIEGFCSTVTWVKGAAIQDALNRCTAETIIIADADVMVDPESLRKSVKSVQSGAAWSMPHHRVFRLNEAFTEQVCQSEIVLIPPRESLDRDVYDGAPGGGIVVVKHVMYNAIGGIPFAFRGWGSEDKCLALLCEKLIGPCERGPADLVHLWHPPQTGVAAAHANVSLLQTLGHAAQKGKDTLVQAVQAMPRPSAGTEQHRRHVIKPVNHAAIQARLTQRRMR